MPLTDRDTAILGFERGWWIESAAMDAKATKEAAIRARFELSATRYYQLLAELLDSPDALQADPLVVRRLRRVRDQRRRARFEARPASEWQGR